MASKRLTAAARDACGRGSSKRLFSQSSCSTSRAAQEPAGADELALRLNQLSLNATTFNPAEQEVLTTLRAFTASVRPKRRRPGTVVAKPKELAGSQLININDDAHYLSEPDLDLEAVSLLYSFTTPTPVSALSAFAHRIAQSVPLSPDSAAPLPISLADPANLPLVEQCLLHASFWKGAAELPRSSAATKRVYTNYHDTTFSGPSTSTATGQNGDFRAHNGPLDHLGNALLGAFASELLVANFPNLPSAVMKAALALYVGPKSVASVAQGWGIAPGRMDRHLVGKHGLEREKLTKHERAFGHLVGGVGPARKKHVLPQGSGASLLRWDRRRAEGDDELVRFEDAAASVARSVVAAIYQLDGFAAARSFARAHFLSRLIAPPGSRHAPPLAAADLMPLLKFNNPTHILSQECKKFGHPSAEHRMLSESGRASNRATFLVGVFSGEDKLGEGFGSSIKMAEWRASEDALRRLYVGGAQLDKGLPSDTWVASEEGASYVGPLPGAAEVAFESTGKYMKEAVALQAASRK